MSICSLNTHTYYFTGRHLPVFDVVLFKIFVSVILAECKFLKMLFFIFPLHFPTVHLFTKNRQVNCFFFLSTYMCIYNRCLWPVYLNGSSAISLLHSDLYKLPLLFSVVHAFRFLLKCKKIMKLHYFCTLFIYSDHV